MLPGYHFSQPHLRHYCLVFAALLLILPSAYAAPITYTVAVDTTAIQGTDGYLDFQFNADGASSLDALVTVDGFSSDSTLDGSSLTDGGGAGVLPGLLTIANSTPFNAVLQGLTFGISLDFLLTFSGDAVESPAAGNDSNTFSLSLLDSSFLPLLTTDLAGAILRSTVTDGGIVVNTIYDVDAFGTPPVTTVTELTGTADLPSVPALLLPVLLLTPSLRRRHAARFASARL